GVGMDSVQLVQRARLVPARLLLSGQVQRLAARPPGLIEVSRQTTDLAEPYKRGGKLGASADTFADRLLHQRAPLRKAPLERIGSACTVAGFCKVSSGLSR